MKFYKPSYLWMLCLLIAVSAASSANSATIYLDPDTAFITTGVGTEFDLELKVDAATQGIRLFQVRINFDTTMFDTVSAPVLGPLFDTSGFPGVFNSYIFYDSALEASVLQLQGLLFGSTSVVDGPGTVAIARLITLNTGFADLSILSYVMTDILNDPIECDAEGAVAFINVPPDQFNLINPESGEEVTGFPDSAIVFSWESSFSVYPSDDIRYRLEVSSVGDFDPDSTITVSALSATEAYFPMEWLELDHDYWWRVTAYGTVHGFDRLSTPEALVFYLASPGSPSEFNLLEPTSGSTVAVVPGGNVTLVWSFSSSPYPGENMLYDLEYSTSSGFEPGVTETIAGLAVTSHIVSANNLVSESWYFWRVTTFGDIYGIERESTPFPDSFFFMVGAEPSDFDLLSPANDVFVNINNVSASVSFDWEDAASILPDDTITYVLHLGPDPNFAPGSEVVLDSVVDLSEVNVSQAELPIAVQEYWKVVAHNRYGYSKSSSSVRAVTYFWRGDINHSRAIDISDLVYLVDYMFTGGPEPSLMESADMNCSGGMDISDLVYLVDYMFTGGPAPTCN